MAKLPRISGKDAVRGLERLGFVQVRQRGSHVVLRRDADEGLPDIIDDEWIENIEELEEMMDRYMHLRKNARDAFEIRYERNVDPDTDRWELCSRVVSRRDIVDKLSEPW